MGFITKEDILYSVNILDITEIYGISLMTAASGNFDYRCKCPSREHKSGNERTGSLYIDSHNNNFYCYGCQANSSVIDFYMLCEDCDFSQALFDMAKMVDPDQIKDIKKVKRENNFPILFKLSNLFRTAMLRHPRDVKWISSIMERADSYIYELETGDVKRAKAIYVKVEKLFKERYSN